MDMDTDMHTTTRTSDAVQPRPRVAQGKQTSSHVGLRRVLFSVFATLATASGSSLASAFLQVFTHSHTTFGGRHRAFQQRWVVENLKRDPTASDTYTYTNTHTHTHTCAAAWLTFSATSSNTWLMPILVLALLSRNNMPLARAQASASALETTRSA